MLLGIGVDDMFVIVNTVDQVPDNLTPEKRFIIGLTHAGPSITITSFTNALAFFFGGFTSLEALNSFCFFACLQVCCLYISVLTIFASSLYWDLKRMHNKRGDCCGMCCCKEDTCCCCGGRFLSAKQQKFSGLYREKIPQQSVNAVMNISDLDKHDEVKQLEPFKDVSVENKIVGMMGDSQLKRSRSLRNMSVRGFITED